MTEAQISFWLFTLFLAVIWMPVMVVLVISAKIDAKIDTLGAKIDIQQEVRAQAFGPRAG